VIIHYNRLGKIIVCASYTQCNYKLMFTLKVYRAVRPKSFSVFDASLINDHCLENYIAS